ncbi:hypothetical protein [Pinibacter soli]|uniref:RHS repeat-associated core domain-containing protein n=1 Tax=Pinibacter soli TaxID=3044211 RepID=A0ABT6REG6_9BACT|nr:hypothetical protein [Pinibacter soli]MDI3320937.1 hypothetical protein [Pinibacter soli]
MKKILLTLVATIATFYFLACKKIIDQINKNPTQTFQFCDIKKFKIWYRDSYYEFTVYYNKAGQPKDVVGKYPDIPGNFAENDQHFRYDKQSRLTDWLVEPAGQQHAWLWHTYHYLSPTKVVDTLYNCWYYDSYITDSHPPYNSALTNTRYLNFDNSGRISTVTDPVSNYTQFFLYDANGNSNMYSAYDSAINIRRTNKIWMFVSLDYSLHNPTALPWGTYHFEYNPYLLPASWTFSDPYGGPFMSSFAANKMEIEYDCNGVPKYY